MAETGHTVAVAGSGNGVAVQVDTGGFERQIVMIGDGAANNARVATTGAISVQTPSDVLRTPIIYSAVAIASGTTTTETAITMTRSTTAAAATTSAASFVIATGKTFRITSITFASRGNATATAQVTNFSLRANSGAVTTTSTPLMLQVGTATPATASAWDRWSQSFPDGLEIVGNGTLQIGITANAVFVTNAPTWYVTITGYEYTTTT